MTVAAALTLVAACAVFGVLWGEVAPRLWHGLRGTIGVASISMFALNGLQAQTMSPVPSAFNEPDFIKWTLTQGGLLLALLIVGWSYRRDLVSLIRTTQQQLTEEREHAQVLTSLVRESAVALTNVAASIQGCQYRQGGGER